MKQEFVKIQGTGNDFILIDRLGSEENIDWSTYVPVMCERKMGIGADGVLVLESDPPNDFRMRIFNPDGSEVDMCGNGARCSASYYFSKTGSESAKFSTLAGLMSADKGKDDSIKLALPSPTETRLDVMIKIEERELSVSYINTGVPHVIVETDKLDDIDVNGLGRSIRYNEEFAPDGTNADFVKVTGTSSIEVRTYERGVEEETYACGTGVIASAVIEVLKGRISQPVDVKTKGGDMMRVYFNIVDSDDLISRINDVRLEGPAKEVYRGTIEI